MSGEQSQFQITRLASKYVEMQKDGRILSNRASIEIVRERIRELLDRLGNNQFPNQIAAVRKLWLEYRGSEGTLEAVKIRKQLDEAFEAVYHDYMGWEQIKEFLDLDSKMVEREAKVAKDLHAILTAEDAYKLTAKLLGAIIAAVQQQPEIPDNIKAHLLKRVEYEFTRIIGEGSGEEPGGSSREIIDA